MMMTCREFEQLWRGHSLGDLPPAAHTHLSSCLSCAAMAQASSTMHAAQPIPSADAAQGVGWLSRRKLLKAGFTGLLASLMMRVRRSFGRLETPGASSMHLS